MASLKAILAEHRKYQPQHTIRTNLGDGYLLSNNPIYRSVRVQALKCGFKFSSKRFHDYDVLPLTQLPRILKSKTIPYRDNVAPLAEIEKRAPGAFSFDQIPKLKPNHLFHESAHGISHTIVRRTLGRARGEREIALQILIQESFANAVESLANAYADSPMHNEFLYKNSYIMETPATRETIRLALRHHTQDAVLKTLVFSFLHANFVQTHRAQSAWKRVRPLITDDDAPTLRPVFKLGFDLDQRFTLFTNAFCLRLEGLRTELLELLDFDFLKYFEARAEYRDCIDQLCRAIKP